MKKLPILFLLFTLGSSVGAMQRRRRRLNKKPRVESQEVKITKEALPKEKIQQEKSSSVLTIFKKTPDISEKHIKKDKLILKLIKSIDNLKEENKELHGELTDKVVNLIGITKRDARQSELNNKVLDCLPTCIVTQFVLLTILFFQVFYTCGCS